MAAGGLCLRIFVWVSINDCFQNLSRRVMNGRIPQGIHDVQTERKMEWNYHAFQIEILKLMKLHWRSIIQNDVWRCLNRFQFTLNVEYNCCLPGGNARRCCCQMLDFGKRWYRFWGELADPLSAPNKYCVATRWPASSKRIGTNLKDSVRNVTPKKQILSCNNEIKPKRDPVYTGRPAYRR